ncbi:MAG: outer membrane protein assembly factor BamE [Hyphomicrobiaceae bacterium]
MPTTAQPQIARRTGKLRAASVILAATVLAAGCATTTLKHGQHYTQAELLQVQPGMSQDEVRMALGSPATTSTVNSGAAYYYISSVRKQTAFLDPKEVDRKVVAVYFTPVGSVERVSQYGMKDGKVFDFISRETPSATKSDQGIIQMLFRNLGRRGSVLSQ